MKEKVIALKMKKNEERKIKEMQNVNRKKERKTERKKKER